MMRKTAVLLTALFSAFAAYGQGVRGLFLSAPDRLLPYIDKNQRTELMDLYDIKRNAVEDSSMDASVKNRLGGDSAIDTLTADYLRLRLNAQATWEMKLLPAGESSAAEGLVIGTSLTVSGEFPESKVSLYTTDWKLLSDTIFTSESLLVKPEKMSDEVFKDRMKQISLVLWAAHFSPDDDFLTLSPSLLFVPHDKTDDFEPLRMQRKLKFDGSTFK